MSQPAIRSQSTCRKRRPPEPKGEDIALDIVFEDDDIIVIDKPKGLVVHPAAGHETGTLVNALIAHCGAQPVRHRRRQAGPASCTGSTRTRPG